MALQLGFSSTFHRRSGCATRSLGYRQTSWPRSRRRPSRDMRQTPFAAQARSQHERCSSPPEYLPPAGPPIGAGTGRSVGLARVIHARARHSGAAPQPGYPRSSRTASPPFLPESAQRLRHHSGDRAPDSRGYGSRARARSIRRSVGSRTRGSSSRLRSRAGSSSSSRRPATPASASTPTSWAKLLRTPGSNGPGWSPGAYRHRDRPASCPPRTR